MSIEAQCPQCSQRYTLPDSFAGKQAKCKSCGVVIAIPERQLAESPATSFFEEELARGDAVVDPNATPCPMCHAPLPPTGMICPSCGVDLETGRKARVEEERSPETRRKKASPRTIKIVGIGLMLLFWSLVLSYGSIGMIVLAAIVNSKALLFVFPILLGISVLFAIGGRIMCLFVPADSNAKATIVVTIGLEASSIVFALMAEASPNEIEAGLLSMAYYLASVTASVTFLIFLKRLAKYVRCDHLADSAQTLSNAGFAMIILFILTMVLTAIVPIFGIMLFFYMLFCIPFAFYLVFRYAMLLWELSGSIHYLRR